MPNRISCPAESRTFAAAMIAEQLRPALASGEDIVIDLSAVESADLGLVQVIEAARISARLEGCTITLAGPAPAAVTSVLDRSGVLWAEEPADLSFWHHQGEAA